MEIREIKTKKFVIDTLTKTKEYKEFTGIQKRVIPLALDNKNVIGKSATGSGKTSLVNLISRFYDATEGEVFVDNVNVKDFDLNTLREEKVTMVLQRAELYSGTIKDNILWGKKDATNEEVIVASKIAQAHDFISDFENGYDTVVAEKGASLSGGQKQRISIARALIRKPEILIFDDSTSALDLKTEANLYKALHEERKSKKRMYDMFDRLV